MSCTTLPDILAYARLLQEHPDEAPPLMKELLISVTNFFRDPERLRALEQRVFPRLFHGKGARPGARVGARLRHRRRGVLDRDAARGSAAR